MNKSFRHILLFTTIIYSFGISFSYAQKNVPVFDVTQYGAVGDGKTLGTKSIQKQLT